EDQRVGLDAHAPQGGHRVLRGLRLELLAGAQERHERHVEAERVLAPGVEAELPDRLEERQRLDVAHGAADLDQDDLGVGGLAGGADALLDLVGDVGDDLDRVREVRAAALLLDDAQVDLARRDVVRAAQVDVEEALVGADVEVGLGAVVRDEDLAVLVRAHRAGVDVDVRVDLDGRDRVPPRPQEGPDARGGDALTEARDHPPGDEDVLPVHGQTTFPGLHRSTRPWRPSSRAGAGGGVRPRADGAPWYSQRARGTASSRPRAGGSAHRRVSDREVTPEDTEGNQTAPAEGVERRGGTDRRAVPTSGRRRRGILFVMTGASGVGKDSIRRVALPQIDDIYYSVSATTRAQRPGEVDGQNYHFLTRERFEELLENDGLLEYAEYVGDLYGTPKAPVEEALSQGRDVLLELELVGARKVKARVPEAVMVFIAPPSMSELERRLRGRGTDTEEKIQKRLARAREEIRAMREFDYVVVNDDLYSAALDFVSIIRAERARAHRITDADIERTLAG